MDYKVPVHVPEIQLTYKNRTKARDRPRITCSRDAYWVLESNWGGQMALLEEFNILLLDRSNRVMALCRISKGGISGTVVDLKIVFAAALKGRASSIIMAHNHPSSNLRPSGADIELTRRFEQAGKVLGIKVLDHLILSPDGGYYSFGDEMAMGR
ncbi:MAG: JAB domain-containing protein [Lewinellaceae bacterium]|nr:JAB domain-containing protein [Lewinellaceae bacterium]